ELLDRPGKVHREVPVLVRAQDEGLRHQQRRDQRRSDDHEGMDRKHAFPFVVVRAALLACTQTQCDRGTHFIAASGARQAAMWRTYQFDARGMLWYWQAEARQ